MLNLKIPTPGILTLIRKGLFTSQMAENDVGT
jgi:hypothetical protein